MIKTKFADSSGEPGVRLVHKRPRPRLGSPNMDDISCPLKAGRIGVYGQTCNPKEKLVFS